MCWNPKTICRLIKPLHTSAFTAVVETDAGTGFLKAMGGGEGVHTLVAELVATRLAKWFGLPILDFAIVTLPECPDIWFVDTAGDPRGKATPGPAFITRKEDGMTWDGTPSQLRRVANPDCIGRLVVFDTWTRNCDRHSFRQDEPFSKPRCNLDNVFLKTDKRGTNLTLIAMDHTHCFTCGGEIKPALSHIDSVKDERVFGLFPAFQKVLGESRKSIRDAVEHLREVTPSVIHDVVNDVPMEWSLSPVARESLGTFLLSRAAYVAETIENRIWPQRRLLNDN